MVLTLPNAMEDVWENASDCKTCVAELPSGDSSIRFTPYKACMKRLRWEMEGHARPEENDCTKFDVAVVHGPCRDGWLCAAILRDSGFQGRILSWNLQPCETAALAGKRVLFVDCCPALALIQGWKAASYLIIDHHPTALERLDAGEPHILYDPSHCGASLLLAWQHGVSQKSSELVYAVLAYDTNSPAVFPDRNVVYDWLDATVHRDRSRLCVQCGVRLLRAPDLSRYIREADRLRTAELEKSVDRLCERAVRRVDARTKLACWIVECDNYALINRFGENVLSDIDREKDVALVYRRGADDKPNEKDKFILSARCRDGLDLARQLCVAYGGNGHGAAAGCQMTKAELDALLGSCTLVINTSD